MIDEITLPDHVFARLDGLNRRAVRDILPHLNLTIDGMRGSFGALLGMLPADGARPSKMAEALRISKQAVGQRLAEMEDRGWILSGPDPSDKRARLVTRTPAGDEINTMTERAIAAMEANWADQIGVERYRVFKKVLFELPRTDSRHDCPLLRSSGNRQRLSGRVDRGCPSLGYPGRGDRWVHRTGDQSVSPMSRCAAGRPRP